jgi:hypothetical protein
MNDKIMVSEEIRHVQSPESATNSQRKFFEQGV